MHRRDYLAGAVGVASGLLAGCTSEGITDSAGATRTATETPDCAARVTIESGGMEPALPKGSEVCITERASYQPVDDPDQPGVITAAVGAEIGYTKLGGTGDIIRYYPDGDESGTAVIARAMAYEDGGYVTKGHNTAEAYPWAAPVDAVIGVVEGVL